MWIGREIEGNRFQVRGGPRREGLLAGHRHPPGCWAEAHRIPVEQPKPEDERGTYLHPETWGMPAERGLARRLAAGPDPIAPPTEPAPTGDLR